MLKYMGHEAINIGIKFSSQDSLRELGQWADKIIMLSEHKTYLEDLRMVIGDNSKIHAVNIGSDKWGNPFNEELTRIIYNVAKALFNELKVTYKIDQEVKRTIFAATFYG
jgi:hypothetical protein